MTGPRPRRRNTTDKCDQRLTLRVPSKSGCVGTGSCPPQHHSLRYSLLIRFGGDLLSHGFCRSTIGAVALNGRVRDGIGCFAHAMSTKPEQQRALRFAGASSRDTRDCLFILFFAGVSKIFLVCFRYVRKGFGWRLAAATAFRSFKSRGTWRPVGRIFWPRMGGRKSPVFWIGIKPIGRLVPVN